MYYSPKNLERFLANLHQEFAEIKCINKFIHKGKTSGEWACYIKEIILSNKQQ